MILVVDVDLSQHSFGAVKNLRDRRKNFYDVVLVKE